MKKSIITLSLILGSVIGMNAQASESGTISTDEVKEDVFNEKANFINIGYGFGSFGQFFFRLDESLTTGSIYDYNSLGPIYLKYEHAMTSKFGFGINAAYENATMTYKDQPTPGNQIYTKVNSYESYSVLMRFNFHFLDNAKFDPYVGGAAGFRNTIRQRTYDNPVYGYDTKEQDPWNFGFDVTFGTRFMFSDYIGAYAEVGLAKSVVQMGITAKF